MSDGPSDMVEYELTCIGPIALCGIGGVAACLTVASKFLRIADK